MYLTIFGLFFFLHFFVYEFFNIFSNKKKYLFFKCIYLSLYKEKLRVVEQNKKLLFSIWTLNRLID